MFTNVRSFNCFLILILFGKKVGIKETNGKTKIRKWKNYLYWNKPNK